MATAEDLLQKAEARKKKKTNKIFQPEKRRAWDYVNHEKQLGAKLNQEQISEQISNEYRNIVGTEIEAIGYKSGNNQEQISEQISNEYRDMNRDKIELKKPSGYKSSNTDLSTFLPSSNDKTIEENIIKTLRRTTGYQQKIMEQITSHIKSMKDIVNVVNIPIATLASRINTDKDTVRTSIKRLQKKKILLKAKGERGRHGCTQIVILNFVLKECLNLFDCYPSSLDEIRYANKNENRNTDILHSSNYINNNTTKNIALPENWLLINIEPLRDIGFAETQLKQLVTKNLNTPEIVQDSINHFAFGLQNNPKVKQYSDPLNVLMGVLRKGQGWTEQNYQSPQEIAQRQFLERKKTEKERLKKLEEEAYKLALDDWLDTISEDLRTTITAKRKGEVDIMPERAKLSQYYKENIWPEKKNEYLFV